MTDKDRDELARLRKEIHECYQMEDRPFKRIDALAERIAHIQGGRE